MNIIKLGPQYQLHVYLCKIEHEPYMDLFEEASSSKLDTDGQDWKCEKFATDLLNSLQDHISVAMLEALRLECSKRIVSHWLEFAPHRLEEDRYKRIAKDLDFEN